MPASPSPLCSLLFPLVLGGCAIVPAKLRPVVRPVERDPHALVLQALAEPDSPAGKQALGQFIEWWTENGGGESGEVGDRSEGSTAVYRVNFSGSVDREPALTHFDEIVPASSHRVKGIHHFRREGTGTTLIASRKNLGEAPLDRFYPPEGIVRPLTAIIRPGSSPGGGRQVHIDLLSPFNEDSVVLANGRKPLAADFSAPWAELLSRTGRLQRRRILDVFTADPKREVQLYLMEPYDPEKEPVIMIHGLLSSPLTWAKVTNHLWGDPEFRKRHQIWHYLYNTSAPALYSSRLLRTQLRELRQILDPEGDDPATRRMTLLTHSMGGLVGKALVVSPGDAFWKAAFTVAPEELKLSPEDRATLNEAFDWRADPSIHRIIFIATPHRGSPVADNFIGRTGRLLAKPPDGFQALYLRISEANPGVFTPDYRHLGEGRLDGIHALSPKQPTLRILSELPLQHGVRVHSIIGNRGKPGPLEESSDGVVPYTSSHLDRAASEKIVPAGHGAIDCEETLIEIKRILGI